MSELFKPQSTIVGDSSGYSLHQLLVISQLYLSLCLWFSLLCLSQSGIPDSFNIYSMKYRAVKSENLLNTSIFVFLHL